MNIGVGAQKRQTVGQLKASVQMLSEMYGLRLRKAKGKKGKRG